MIVEAPAEFWDWFVGLDDAGRSGDVRARERHDVALALLLDLFDAPFPPHRERETPVMAWVRQAHRHPVWRLVGHGPGGPGSSEVRFHCAFPVGTRVALITSTSGNQARIGDLFPRVVMARTELLVDHWMGDRARGQQSSRPGLTRGFENGDEHVALALAQLGTAPRVFAVRDALLQAPSVRRAAARVRRAPQPVCA